MFKTRSKMLFVSVVLSTLYTIYLITYFNGAANENVGGAIAAAIVTPHMIITGIGTVFGWIGFLAKKSWAALVAAILYSVGGLVFLMYAMFSIPLLILGFIGYSKQKKLCKTEAAN